MYWLFIIAFIVFFVFARDFLQLPRYRTIPIVWGIRTRKDSRTSDGFINRIWNSSYAAFKTLKSKTSVKLVCEDLDLGS